MSNEHAAKKSKYSAGFFLRLLVLIALLGFVAFETYSAINANKTIGKLVNVMEGSPVSKVSDVLNRKPTKTRTVSMTVDVEAMKKEIEELQAQIDSGDLGIPEQYRIKTKITRMKPKLETPEITYQVDTYRFLLNPFVGQYVEVAHRDGVVEKILTDEIFTLDSLKSDLNVKKSGRDAPLVAGGFGGRAPDEDDQDDEDVEEDEPNEDEQDRDEDDQDRDEDEGGGEDQ